MSIYLTQQVSYATKVEAFNLRGLQNQVSVKACDSGIYAISRSSLESRIRYMHMAEELPSRLAKSTQPYGLVPKFINVLPRFDKFHFEAPTLVVEMKSGGEVLHSFDMFETGTSKMGLYAGKPTSEHFKQIMALGLDLYATVPAGNVNLAGYAAYIQAWRGINAFFFVGGGETSGADPLTGWMFKKNVDELALGLADKGEKDGAFLNMSAVKLAAGMTQTYKPGEIRLNTQPATHSPYKGFVFPYFKEMLTADPDTPFQDFLKLYHHCFATSAEEAAQSIEVIRRGFRFLASSYAGRVIQHIYFGMKLCIEAGGSLIIYGDGSEYAGFAIKGDELSLLVRNRIKGSYAEDDVETALEQLSSHSAAVKKMYSLIVAIGRLDGGEEQRTYEDCLQNPRVLREMILSRGAKDIQELRESLSEYVGKLRYKQVYWEVNSASLLKFIQKLTHGANMIDEPMYLHIDVMMNRSSNLLEYLSVFGAQAPSLYFGDTVKQIAATGKDDPNLRLVDKKRALPHIPYVKKGLIQAAQDWATIHRSHAFKFQGPRGKVGPNAPFSDSKSRSGLITSPEFDDFYSLLRLWSYAETNDESGSSKKGGKKRAAEDVDMGGEASSSKKSKMAFTFI